MSSAKNTDSLFANGLPALYIVAFLSGISLGLFNPFISTLMKQNGFNNIIIGANSTLYFFIIAIITPSVPNGLRKIGLRRIMMLGFFLMGISAPIFPMTHNLFIWFLVRALMGLACGLYIISGQIAINYFCSDRNRAAVNGLYALALGLGFGLGPVIGAMVYDLDPQITFSLGGGLILSGIVVVYFGLPEKKIKYRKPRLRIIHKLKLPLQGSFAYGFSEATLVSLYPLYLLEQNYGIDRISYIFVLFIVGGLISTVPLSYLADRLGKIKVLIGSTIVVIVSLLGLSLVQDRDIVPILTLIAGIGMSPIFPLSLALIGSRVTVNELSSGSALFTSTYGAGCTAGPILSAIVMTFLGDRSIFALMLILFCIFLLNLSRDRQPIDRSGVKSLWAEISSLKSEVRSLRSEIRRRDLNSQKLTTNHQSLAKSSLNSTGEI